MCRTLAESAAACTRSPTRRSAPNTHASANRKCMKAVPPRSVARIRNASADAAPDATCGGLARQAGSGDMDGLDVDELADAEARELPAVTALLDAAERETRIGAHGVVHEHAAAFDRFCRDPLAACEVARNHAATQAERHRFAIAIASASSRTGTI